MISYNIKITKKLNYFQRYLLTKLSWVFIKHQIRILLKRTRKQKLFVWSLLNVDYFWIFMVIFDREFCIYFLSCISFDVFSVPKYFLASAVHSSFLQSCFLIYIMVFAFQGKVGWNFVKFYLYLFWISEWLFEVFFIVLCN